MFFTPNHCTTLLLFLVEKSVCIKKYNPLNRVTSVWAIEDFKEVKVTIHFNVYMKVNLVALSVKEIVSASYSCRIHS